MIVVVLQGVMLLMFASGATAAVVLGRSFAMQSLAYAYVALSQAIVLIAAASYAGFLRRRSRASLAGCIVGGAVVGLLANLIASKFVSSVVICVEAVMV